MVDKKKKIVFDGFLTKQGQQTNKNIAPRYVRMTRTDLEWFHNQEEAKYNDVPLGTIPFLSIYSVIPAKRDKNTSDIYIECQSWKKKNVEKGPRKFVFGAKTENERDEWITSIEYMRVMTLHEYFIKKYANISLPIDTNNPKSRKIGSNSTNFEGQTSLGSMIKKQYDVVAQNPIMTKKLGVSKKNSIMNHLIDRKRLSSFSADSYQTMGNHENLIRETAAKIKTIFNAHISHFFGQIAENGIKGNAFQANILGKKPDVLKSVNFVKNESPSSNATNYKFHNNEFGREDMNVESPKMVKVGSEKVRNKIEMEFNMSPEYYEDVQARKSEKSPPMNLNTIDEVDNEHDLTMELERQKHAAPDNSGGNSRKDRSATFRPYSHNKDNEKVDMNELRESSKNINDPRVTESDKNLLISIKERVASTEPTQMHPERKEEQKHEVERTIRDSFNVYEAAPIGVKLQPKHHPVKTEYRIQYNEETKDSPMNMSQKSTSRYSVPESENFGDKEFIISTKNNQIKDPIGARKVYEAEVISKKKGENKGLSIRTIQTGLSRFQGNALEVNHFQDSYVDNSKLNISQQQAINMLSKEFPLNERGRTSPYISNTQFMHHENANNSYYSRQTMAGNGKDGEASPEFAEKKMGINSFHPMLGASSGSPNVVDSNNMHNEPNAGMSSFMMQMMMLMQQNTALIVQQQEMMRKMSVERSVSKSRSRSKPKRLDGLSKFLNKNDQHQESKSQIGITNYSELDSVHEKDEEGDAPENIRGVSMSPERPKSHINQLNTKSSSKPKGESSVKPTVFEKTMGIVLADTSCRVTPNVHLREGDIVTVERYIPELDLLQ